jgi:transposase
MDNIIQVPLNLPDVRALSTQRTEQGHWLIRVESALEGTQCRCCGREIRHQHGWDAVVRLRHLPLFDVPVLIEVRPKWYRCPYCTGTPTTTQRCAWYELRNPNTKAYEPWALRMVINSTVMDAARKLGVSEEILDGILDRWIERAVDWDAWERPNTPRSQGRCGRFASGLEISNRRNGNGSNGASSTRRRSRPPITCGKT